MSFLNIEPDTEKGKIQLETIKWAEEQINIVFKKFFNNSFHLINSFSVSFNPEANGQQMQVSISQGLPKTEAELEKAIELISKEMRESFKRKQEVQEAMSQKGT